MKTSFCQTTMTSSTLAVLSLTTILGTSMNQVIAGNPAEVPASVHTTYVPEGFDTNDRVQIVAEGTFANACYRPGAVIATVDADKKVISLDASAYYWDGVCAQVLVNWHQVVDLGNVELGAYKIVQKGTDDRMGSLNVKLATNSGPDDYLYAPVSQAFYQSKDGKHTLTVTGEFTNDCMTLVDVVTHVQSNVITVQPIAEKSDSTTCNEGKFSFKRETNLGQIQDGRYLIHVRSLNGQAVNTLVNIEN